MLQALLRGKLAPKQENSEDILTSSVFGLLGYIPADKGLMPLLRLAYVEGGSARGSWRLPNLEVTTMVFWPTHSTEFCGSTEPDVLIWARDPTGGRHILLVEVKLWSPKSSRPDTSASLVTDQLAKEWCVLVHLCKQENATPHLFYVTSDRQYPRFDIDESAHEYSAKCPEWACDYPFNCAWFSWVDVAEQFQDCEERCLREIALVCLRLDLVHFRGFSKLAPIDLSWAFTVPRQSYSFPIKAPTIEWSYQ